MILNYCCQEGSWSQTSFHSPLLISGSHDPLGTDCPVTILVWHVAKQS